MTARISRGVRHFGVAAMLIVAAVGPANAQGRISTGTLRTEAKAQAVRVAAEYLSNLGPTFRSAAPPAQTGAAGWWLLIRPEAQILTGDEDAFQGVVFKMTGNYARFRSKQLQAGGPWVVDMDRTWWAFPVSGGFESDGSFQRINAIAEVGIVPIRPGMFKSTNQWQVGLFVQGGYKFRTDDSTAATEPDLEGGAADESEEETESALGRVRLDTRVNVPFDLTSTMKVQVIGRGNVWMDFLNSAEYYRLEGTLRIPLAGDKYFDLNWERGSGAPNFNKGDQWSANLTVTF